MLHSHQAASTRTQKYKSRTPYCGPHSPSASETSSLDPVPTNMLHRLCQTSKLSEQRDNGAQASHVGHMHAHMSCHIYMCMLQLYGRRPCTHLPWPVTRPHDRTSCSNPILHLQKGKENTFACRKAHLCLRCGAIGLARLNSESSDICYIIF